MSEYFSYFPTTQHDLTNVGQTIDVTNILRRFIIRNNLQDRTDVFYEYTLQSGDRPDVVAEKYYGDSDLAWLVLHFNDLTDPYFDYPMFDKDLETFIKNKYQSIPRAQSLVHEYRQIIRNKSTRIDGSTIDKKYIVVDQTTYNSLSESNRELITKYDFEVDANDKKRNIKLLDKRYINQVKSEVEVILKDGI
jgi:hypothetical protein